MVVLLLCAAGLAALTMQVRCIDSAREAARLAARGDQRAAATPAPGGAAIELRRDGDYMVARVSARSPLLPGVVIVGQAVAAVEPGG
ncbi:TadE family type IV pilus minor pilin [Mycolicibacterium sp.]|uniref:TadE family type IV pilus minor pilin n=1 Tax=Mycolicibacterium sp. TaxID=2320850 RepID=UPI0037CA73D5